METKINIDMLSEGIALKGNLFVDKNLLVLAKGAKMRKNVLDVLKRWDFAEFIFELDEQAEDVDMQAVEAGDISSLIDVAKNPKVVKFQQKDALYFKNYKKKFSELKNFVGYTFREFKKNMRVDIDKLSETMRGLYVFVRDNKMDVLRYLFGYRKQATIGITHHTIRVTVLAIIVGMRLKIPFFKIIELSVTSVLHVIGMLSLPKDLFDEGKIEYRDNDEKVKAHILYGYNTMKMLHFPLNVQLGILEQRENERGTGFPRQVKSELRSIYGKIIQACCALENELYNVCINPKMTNFSVMRTFVENKDGLYDKDVMNALLENLSYFPIGTYVKLKNGKKGLVIDAKPTTPVAPIVRLCNEFDDNGKPLCVQTLAGENKIASVFNHVASLRTAWDMESWRFADENTE